MGNLIKVLGMVAVMIVAIALGTAKMAIDKMGPGQLGDVVLKGMGLFVGLPFMVFLCVVLAVGWLNVLRKESGQPQPASHQVVDANYMMQSPVQFDPRLLPGYVDPALLRQRYDAGQAIQRSVGNGMQSGSERDWTQFGGSE